MYYIYLTLGNNVCLVFDAASSVQREAMSKYLWEYDDGVFNVWCKQCTYPKAFFVSIFISSDYKHILLCV